MNINNFDEATGVVKDNSVVENTILTKEEILSKEQKKKTQALKVEYAFLGKWLWAYFISMIPSLIVGVLSTFDRDFAASALLYDSAFNMSLVGLIISIVVCLARVVILILLGQYERNYRIAGILLIPSLIVSLLPVIIFKKGTPDYYTVFSIIVALIGLVGTYLEIKTHKEVTEKVEQTLSSNWSNLWKWIVACAVATLFSTALLLFARSVLEIAPYDMIYTFLGISILIIERAAIIGSIVVTVVELVYLYRTAKLFRYLSY